MLTQIRHGQLIYLLTAIGLSPGGIYNMGK